MDAGMVVMRLHGTSGRPTVAEIVREAGLSNQAFYRHFASKDDLVTAIVDAGARRLAAYVERRVAATTSRSTRSAPGSPPCWRRRPIPRRPSRPAP